MKFPLGKIAGWIGRTVLTAALSAAAERLARPRPTTRTVNDSAAPTAAPAQEQQDA